MSNIHRIGDQILFKSTQIAATATGNGTGVDTLGFEDLAFVVHGVTASASTIDAKVQSSATSGGTYADVSGAAIVQIPASQTSKVSLINVKASKCSRWVRCLVTIAGTSTVDVVVVLANARYKAVTQDTTMVSV